MKQLAYVSLSALAMSIASAAGCSDVPISVTFLAPAAAPASIWNDIANSAYQNGVGGVSAVIHINRDCVTGTHDATLILSRAKRGVWMQYPSAIQGSLIDAGPASFAGGAAFETHSIEINVHNITGYTVLPPSTAATFYTAVGSTFAGPDGKTYQLRFHPDEYTCPAGAICVPDLENGTNAANMNLPVETAWTQVVYTPRNPTQPWSSTNADSWIVDGELQLNNDTALERSTLFLDTKTQVHYGQYSMPFKIAIVALAPLP
jgi:hypothetical protein